jgi:hypothetical protein
MAQNNGKAVEEGLYAAKGMCVRAIKSIWLVG